MSDIGEARQGPYPRAVEGQELYLILHKVRDQPAFDIAQRVCPNPPCQPDCGCWDGERCSEAEAWVIPTSGHRAYPYLYWKIEDLFDASDYPHDHPHTHLDKHIPSNLPDHYQTQAQSSKLDLRSLLGLIRPSNFKKRAI